MRIKLVTSLLTCVVPPVCVYFLLTQFSHTWRAALSGLLPHDPRTAHRVAYEHHHHHQHHPRSGHNDDNDNIHNLAHVRRKLQGRSLKSPHIHNSVNRDVRNAYLHNSRKRSQQQRYEEKERPNIDLPVLLPTAPPIQTYKDMMKHTTETYPMSKQHNASHLLHTAKKLRNKKSPTASDKQTFEILRNFRVNFKFKNASMLLDDKNDFRKTMTFSDKRIFDPPPDLPACPAVSPLLIGPSVPSILQVEFSDIGHAHPDMLAGGRYSPRHCVARHRVAVVIPYRNRLWHLKVLLHNLHPVLQRQQLEYGVYVVEQQMPGVFNKAMMMNIGFVEAMKRQAYQCVIFHDVDLIPETDHNTYHCLHSPQHMAPAIDKFNYTLPYKEIFGGVISLSREDFLQVNGFSNLYFGWGAEDDDMYHRVMTLGRNITRPDMKVGRYQMIVHTRDNLNSNAPRNDDLLAKSEDRMRWDGLSKLNYDILSEDVEASHTRLLVFPRRHRSVVKLPLKGGGAKDGRGGAKEDTDNEDDMELFGFNKTELNNMKYFNMR